MSQKIEMYSVTSLKSTRELDTRGSIVKASIVISDPSDHITHRNCPHLQTLQNNSLQTCPKTSRPSKEATQPGLAQKHSKLCLSKASVFRVGVWGCSTRQTMCVKSETRGQRARSEKRRPKTPRNRGFWPILGVALVKEHVQNRLAASQTHPPTLPGSVVLSPWGLLGWRNGWAKKATNQNSAEG